MQNLKVKMLSVAIAALTAATPILSSYVAYASDITVNDDGTVTTAYGVQGEAGAEAYVAEGEVSGGLDIMGVKVDVGLKGKLGGAGAKAGGHISTGGVTANASLGFLAGVGLDVSIDWTNFKWKW